MIVWHYTTESILPRLQAVGRLMPSSAGSQNEEEKPLLWFSANQKWEVTATKMVPALFRGLRQLTFQEQLNDYGCLRLGLSSDDHRLMRWKAACKAALITRDDRVHMIKSARGRGSNPAKQYYASLESIPLDELKIQKLVNSKWQKID